MIVLFGLLLPPAELLLLSLVADHYGWWAVAGACAAGIVIGQVLLRWRGRVFLRQAQDAVRQDRMPTEALLGGIAWYVAGILFIVPGFITDLLALLVLLPPVRRRFLGRFASVAEDRLMAMHGAPQGHVYEGEATKIDEDAPKLPEDDHKEPRP